MAQFLEFFGNHVVLFGLFFGISAALAWTFLKGGSSTRVNPMSATRLINDQGALVLDVRPGSDFDAGHVVNSLNVPVSELEQGLGRLEKYKSKPILPICANGHQAAAAAKTLRQQGFEHIFVITGGIAAWRDANLPLTKK